ncbi:MAG: aldo/keto reductase [Reyranella sp.]|uniref:aldo/keto reductase n=1 Tax=Reyranella sp. TaxID=1929291 RepID=UPI002730E457|nr:aldo/keto reductase [Reyranella sp.]MDP1961081.1 aldo/keto reductase [Reyranella sp.]MDP2378779.1 aldo/keto reductase [Reyranella sp.]
MTLTRSALLGLTGAAVLSAGRSVAQTTPGVRMHQRKIPSNGEMLPIVGCGTWRTFDVGAKPEDRAPLAEVLRILFEAGGSVIDTSPMYGSAEAVVGDLLAAAGTRSKAFIATKVWTSGHDNGVAQMRQSMRLLKTDRIDLMQIHNLLDWRAHLPTLRAWKTEGRIRLMGVTHYTQSAHDELEAVLRAEKWDFVQLNYALDDRAVERRLLPLAAERGIAVLVNQPFGGGGLLRKLSSRKLPDWAGEIGCASWAQLLLKFVLANPTVTAVIPGTGKPEHMKDNAQAGLGVYPDAAILKKMVAILGS